MVTILPEECLKMRVMQGLDALGYSEHIDYDLVESTNPAFQNAVVRVNVFRDHRQVRPCPNLSSGVTPLPRSLRAALMLQTSGHLMHLM